MKDGPVLRDRPARRARSRAILPRVDVLERRMLLYATLGGSFAYGSRITYSFAPDGTNIGGSPSALFSSMASKGYSADQWQAAFEKAAAVWEAAANINLALVSDDGSSFGTTGNQQDDPRFGDIRIGGQALGSGTLATCFLPPPINGGSIAGDMVINTIQPWKINTDYDIQTVAIHEFGHALGLDHSSVSTADMYASYNSMKQSLTSDDTAGIRAVWGTRQPDAFDAVASNNSYTTASNLSPYITSAAQATIAGLDISSGVDGDWYVVTAPNNTSGSLTVTMQSSNLSSLSPKMSLYNASMTNLSTVSAANVYGATVTTSTITGVLPGQKFFIRASAANGGPSGVGSYGLLVNFGTGAMNPVPPPNTTVASAPDQGGGSSNESADSLTFDKHFRQAVTIVDAGREVIEFGLPPAEVSSIASIATALRPIARREAGAPGPHSAVIQAVDDVVNALVRH